MIDRILFLAQSLRHKNVSVSTPEIIDCLSALAVAPSYGEPTIKTIIKASLIKDKDCYHLFDEAYKDAFPAGDDLKEMFEAMTGETEMEIMNPNKHPEAGEEKGKDASEVNKSDKSNKSDGIYLPGREALMEIPFLYSSMKQKEEMLSVIRELSRKMARNMSVRKKAGGRRLNYRKVWRKSMQTGGIPFEPVWQDRQTNKPRTFILCDFSGSMNSYLPFVLQFVFTFAVCYSTVRVFGFVDAIEEITSKIDPVDISKSVQTVYTSARISRQGKTDYGNALKGFCRYYSHELTSRSTVIIVGDARNNAFNPRAHLLEEIKSKSAALYWLNPERWYHWGFADSCMDKYTPYCDGVFQMADLSQLKYFAEYLAAPSGRPDSFPFLPVSKEKWNIYLRFLQNWQKSM